MNPMANVEGQVDSVIGSAYSVVKYVADNMDSLIALVGEQNSAIGIAMESLRRTYSEVGYDLLTATFDTGTTIHSHTDVLIDSSTYSVYRWDGALPKVVPPNSTPASTGGVGAGA